MERSGEDISCKKVRSFLRIFLYEPTTATRESPNAPEATSGKKAPSFLGEIAGRRLRGAYKMSVAILTSPSTLSGPAASFPSPQNAHNPW